ncbi:MAG: hypothetical protein J2P20_04860 [Pseudonocardia sp.]|nr:hypothetical protein [Pseudonocardia sp.]MBO0874465.1 hypothetical protein [Pseudonocardia sp.]
MREPLRLVGGAFTAGLVVLAVALVVIWAVAAALGQPGPGASVLAGHLVAAVLAVALQRIADRGAATAGRLAAVGAVLVVAAVIAVYWWN